MNEIKCPHCHKAFKVDEAGYADILKQVRDDEFEQQLHDRLELAEKDKLNALELVKQQVNNEMQKAAAEKDAAILELKAKLDAGEVAKKLAVTDALKSIEKERDALKNELQQAKKDSEAASELARANHTTQLQEASSRKDAEIQELKAKISTQEAAAKHAGRPSPGHDAPDFHSGRTGCRGSAGHFRTGCRCPTYP